MRTFLIDFPSIIIPTMIGVLRKKPNANREVICKRVHGSLSGKFRALGITKEDTVIFVRDSSDNWRLDIYPKYKHNRAKRKKPEFEKIKIYRDQVLNAMTVAFRRSHEGPLISMNVPRCEADDIIAVLAKSFNTETIIVSSDKDFLQLKSDIVSIVDSGGNDIDKKYDIESHILFGDEADSIPSVSCFGEYSIDGQRVWGLTPDNLKYFTKNGLLDFETFPRFRETYIRNKSLIDFEEIPECYANAILQKFEKEMESINAIMEYRNEFVELPN